MFNFKSLKLVKRCDSESTSSFVGIRRDKNNKLEFRLPHGFDDFPEDDFEQTKRLFFKMYSTFRKFERDSTRKILDKKPVSKDNITTHGNGYHFKDKEDTEVILYSKIALIENLLEAYHDLALDVMERRIGQDERVDYSKMEHYLHRAIYLPNNVIFIDEMDLPRQTLRYEAMTLIDLFCFILFELQTELEQDTEPRVRELAHRFSEQHLNHEQSLFNEETFEITIRTLKDVLDEVDKRTTYKDDDYWRLYEAVELFLYGELDMEKPHEDGTYWGINNFSSVWEDMCNTYAFANFDVLYADTNIIFNGKKIKSGSQNSDFINPFFINFRNKNRWMRPDFIKEDIIIKGNKTKWLKDLKIKNNNNIFTISIKPFDKNDRDFLFFCTKFKIYKSNNKKINGEYKFENIPKLELKKLTFVCDKFIIYDWKYIGINCLINENKKIKTDITKQLCYEFSLQKVKNSVIKSQFVIPWFYSKYRNNDNAADLVDDEILHSRLRDNDIKVLKGNFTIIQAAYLNHD